MPYTDEFGFGEGASPSATKSYHRYGWGDLGPTAGPVPGESGFWQPSLANRSPSGGSNGGSRHDDPDLLTRIWRSLFGGPKQQQITSQALPPPPGEQSYAGPFGGTDYSMPPAPTGYRPATKLSSSREIADKINAMIGGGNTPPPVGKVDFAMGPNGQMDPLSSPFELGGDSAWYTGRVATTPGGADFDFRAPYPKRPPPIDMRTPPRQPVPAFTLNPFGRGNNPFEGILGGYQRADGGQIPGFMRGGYPELYSMPIRRTFDSGGENYVGSHGGSSSGRADDVNARLSAKEYVMDAESMALLGDGNPDHGAKKMDQMRVQLRKEKGKALAKGKISPNAKPAMAYVAGNPMGDGLRRRGREKK